jgi:WD40 repeat protein
MFKRYSAVLMIVSVWSCGNPVSAGALGGAVSQHVANQVSRSTSNAINKHLADRLIIPQLRIRNGSGEVLHLSVAANERYIASVHQDGSVRVWDTRQGVQRPKIYIQGARFQQALPLSGPELIVVADKEGSVDVFEIHTGQFKKRIVQGRGVTAMAFDADQQLLLIAFANGEVKSWTVPGFNESFVVNTPYDDDIKFVAIDETKQNLILAGEGGFVDQWNIKRGAKNLALIKDIDDVQGFWQDTKETLMIRENDRVLRIMNQQKMIVVENLDDYEALAINSDFSLMALASDKPDIQLFQLNGAEMRPLKKISLDREVSHLSFLNNSRHLLAVDENGVLVVFEVQSGTRLMQLIATDKGWTVVDNSGRFDSSEQGMPNVSWEADDTDIPLNNFSETHYEPGLFANHLEESDFINAKPFVVKEGIKLPPAVKIIPPDTEKLAGKAFTIEVEALGQGGGVGEIRLFHNGKVLDSNALLEMTESGDEAVVKKVAAFKVIPVHGVNDFKAIAVNDMGIESHSDVIQERFNVKQRQTTFHLLTVGINKYQDSRLNLDYSVADAESINAIFSNQSTLVHNGIKSHKLRDNLATKRAILHQLTELSQAEQQDVLGIYLAGHGIAVDGEWYFLPHETMLQDNLNYYKQIGVSAAEIKDILISAQAQQIVILVDACYSGAGLQSFRKLQDAQRHFGRSISKNVGLVIMAATRKDQEAAELADLGHGLFTYVVSEGMAGKADLQPRNQLISAHEVADFSVKVIPEFSSKYLGAAQEPTAFMMGKDFVILSSGNQDTYNP